MRAKLAARVALLLSGVLWTACRASAEVMEGEHLFILGPGFGVPHHLSLDLTRNTDLDLDGNGLIDNFERFEVHEKTLYNRTATGASAAVGAGIQWSVGKNIVLGSEARWNFASIAEDSFGDSFFMDARGYAWLGWKWSAPL